MNRSQAKKVKEAMGLFVQTTVNEILITTSKMISFILSLENGTRQINLVQTMDGEVEQETYATTQSNQACGRSTWFNQWTGKLKRRPMRPQRVTMPPYRAKLKAVRNGLCDHLQVHFATAQSGCVFSKFRLNFKALLWYLLGVIPFLTRFYGFHINKIILFIVKTHNLRDIIADILLSTRSL